MIAVKERIKKSEGYKNVPYQLEYTTTDGKKIKAVCADQKITNLLLNPDLSYSDKTEIFMDSSLERFNKLYAAAGHPNCIFEINFKELNMITSSKIMEITE